METRRMKAYNARAHLLSPFRYIFKPKVDDLTKKPMTSNLLTSYSRYKKHPLSGNFKQNLQKFLKSLNPKENTSSLLVTVKNFMEQKQLYAKNYNLTKGNFKKINKEAINNIININKNYSRENNIQKYNKRYRYLVRSISANENNSNISFKNISNSMLDDIFKYKPYISFDETNIKVVDKAPTKYQYFFQHINNQSKEYNYSKEQDLFSPISRNFKSIKNNIINKRVSFENKVLNKLNEQKEFNNSYSEKDFKQNALKPKYPEYNRKKDHFNEKINNEFIENFKILKQKIKKQNNANDSIKNDIKRQQSLNKYKIQVGIVKLNEYKVKLRQLKKLNSNIY